MLLHPTFLKLERMRLSGMAAALRDQLNTPDIDTMPFLDRLGLMVEHEEAVRGDRRLARRLHTAKLRLQASMANLDYGTSRGLDQRLMLHLASCQWIRRQQNVIITGPTEVGKSYVACALAHKACLENFKTRYYRLTRLLEALQTASEEGTYLKALKSLYAWMYWCWMTGDSIVLIIDSSVTSWNYLMIATPFDLPLPRVSIPWENSMRPWKIRP